LTSEAIVALGQSLINTIQEKPEGPLAVVPCTNPRVPVRERLPARVVEVPSLACRRSG